MPDYVIEDLDSCNIKVKCERHHAKELSDFFTFKVPGHKFMPSYRAKKWDGQIKLYNMYSQKIYAGLESYIVKFCKERGYTIETCLLYTSPSPRDRQKSRMPSSA